MEDGNKTFLKLFNRYNFRVKVETPSVGKYKHRVLTDVKLIDKKPIGEYDDDADDYTNMPDELFNKVCYTKDFLNLSQEEKGVYFKVAFPKPTKEGFTPRDIMNAVETFEKESRRIFRDTWGNDGIKYIDTRSIYFEGFAEVSTDTFRIIWGS